MYLKSHVIKTGLVISLLYLADLVQAEPSMDEGRPNILLIMSDDMGFSDIGCYGGEIDTPNLDRLAKNGLRFSQFYNAARCCPTRASLLTGVYQHQTGIGLMLGNRNLPGYSGDLGKNVLTIAEVLVKNGYGTYMTGKWHVTRFTRPQGPKENWPLQRGFEEFYGIIKGAGSFYDPVTLCRGNTYITPDNDPEYKPEVFYFTDAINDNAVMYLRQHFNESPDKPFFLYLAHTAAHWPMHALPEDIARYEGKYDGGFEPIRKARFERLKQIGLIDPSWALSAQSVNWEKVKHKSWDIRNMEVYAAMVDRMDQGIGKIIRELEVREQLDNTLIFYLQDNGGCAEGYGRNSPKEPYPTDLKPMRPDELQTRTWPPMQTRDGKPVRHGPGVVAGPADTFIGYGQGWANVSNTPFREYKHFVHEGGIATPLIVHWPQGLDGARKGELEHQPGHLIDIMATCLDVAGVPYPEDYGGRDILPLEGISLVPAFQGKPLNRKDALYFEHHLNSAIRDGKWKLVRKGSPRDGKIHPWELYDMEADRTETNDLATNYPEKVSELKAKWEAWAKRTNVLPWPFEAEIN